MKRWSSRSSTIPAPSSRRSFRFSSRTRPEQPHPGNRRHAARPSEHVLRVPPLARRGWRSYRRRRAADPALQPRRGTAGRVGSPRPRRRAPRRGVELPGVTGAVPEVDTFSRAWEDRTGFRRRQRMAQRIYRLTELRRVERVRGRPRPATGLDRSLLLAWMTAFGEEATAEARPAARPNESSTNA